MHFSAPQTWGADGAMPPLMNGRRSRQSIAKFQTRSRKSLQADTYDLRTQRSMARDKAKAKLSFTANTLYVS
jgi:hypothetical protein